MTIKELQEKRAVALKTAEDIRLKYQGKPEGMTGEEEASWEKALDDAEACQKQIVRLQREEKAKAWGKQAATDLPTAGTKDDDGDDGDGTKDMIPFEQGNIDPRLSRAIKVSQTPEYKSAFIKMLRIKEYRQACTPQELKALSEGIDTAGGFLVVPEFNNSLIKKLPGATAIRPLARIFNVSSNIVKFPKVNYTTDDKYTSPARITWTGESPASSSAADVTDPVFGEEDVIVHTAMAGIKVGNDLIEDAAFDLMGYLADIFAEAYGLGEDDAFINGNGQGRPEGLLNATGVGGTPIITGVVSGSAATLLPDGLIDLFYALPRQYRAMARFVMNSQTAKVARKLKDAQNRYLWDSMSQGGLTTDGDRDSLLGKPVEIDEFMPDVAANAYPIIFGDFRGYYIADRVGMSMQVLREVYAETNQVKIVARRRVGAGVLEPFRFRAQQCHT